MKITVIQRLRTAVLHSGYFRSVLTLAGGTASGQLLLLLAAPALTRLYSPTDHGLYGTLAAFLAVALPIGALRYDVAIVSAKTDKDAADLLWLSIVLGGMTSLLLACVLYAAIEIRTLGFGTLPRKTLFVAILLLIAAQIFAALRYWALRKEQFGLVARSTALQNGARAVAPLVAASLSIGFLGLACGDLIGRFVGLRGLFLNARTSLLGGNVRERLAAARNMALEHRAFPLYSLPSALADAIALNLPLPLITAAYGPVAAGYFALVQRVFQAPLALVGMSIADVYHARLARSARDTTGSMRSLFLWTLGILAVIGLVPTIVILWAGEEVFVFAFGARWAPAGDLATAMAPWFFATIVVSPLGRTMQVLGGQSVKLPLDVARLAAIFIVFAVVPGTGAGLHRTVFVLSVSQALIYMCYLIAIVMVLRRAEHTAGRVIASSR